MRKSISLVAALALSSSVAFAGYGSNAGYSTTKKVNIENLQWVLVGYPGGSAVTTPTSGSSTVAAQDSIPGTNTYNGDIYFPENWNYTESDLSNVDSNDTMTIGQGFEDNATFSITAKSTYWSQLLAHSNYSISNVGEPAVEFTQNADFMNLASTASMPSATMVIKLDGTDTTTDAILELDFHNQYLGKTFTLYLDANDSNNTSYTMTVVAGTSYILNDPSGSSLGPTTNQLLEFNTSHGGFGAYGSASGITNDGNISFGVSGLNDYMGVAGTISKDANYTVAKFNALGQSWMTYEANLTGGTVISDGGLQDSSGNVNTVEKGNAYWYRLNLNSTTDLNMSVTLRDEDVGVGDLSLLDDRWHLTALPKGHIKHSQGGIVIETIATAGGTTYFSSKGVVGDIEDTTTNSIAIDVAAGSTSVVVAQNINNFLDGNGTLFEVPIRAYPIGTSDKILIVSDTVVDFNLSGLNVPNVYSIAGYSYEGVEGKTKLGESAIAIKMNEGFFDRVGAGTFTIEIPDLFSGFTGVDVNLSGVASTGAAVAANLATLKSNIETAMYNQACLHTNGGDYNITTFDSDFSGVDDSFLIALRAKGERNITADTTNPTVCTANGITRSNYNDKYLRIGVRENTYVTPYLNKKDGNYSALHIIDTSGNVYAKGSITTVNMSNATPVTIADAGYNAASSTAGTAGALGIEGNRTTLFGSYVDWNLSMGPDSTTVNPENNYTYFVTSSRTLRLAESNVTDYNLSGASKYSILSQTDKNDVLQDAYYLTSATRIVSPWVTDSEDVNSTFLKGVISNVYTLADLAQAPLVTGGDLSTTSGGIASYSSSTDLNVNTVWSVDMPTSGPLYDIISATPAGTIPSRILTFRNGSYVSINFNKTTNTSEWFDSEDLYFISAFNGYWVRTDSSMTSYTINTATSADSGEKVIKTTYDMTDGTTSNYVFNKWIVDNVGSSSGLDTSMHNISIGDSNMSAQFTSVSGGAERYEILIDPFTFPDFTETGFGATTKSIVITNGFTSSTVGSDITYSYTKPSAPTVSGTSNNDLTVSAVDGSLEVHLGYVDEANLSFTRLFSQTDTAVTIRPQDLNVTSQFSTSANSYDVIGSDINETKIRLFNVGADGLSSDVTTVIYPLFNVLLINPSTSGGEYNLSLATMSDVNQSEWIDADGDGSGTLESLVVYNIISDDGSDTIANAIPSRYDANGTLITVSATHPDFAGGLATDGIQILSSVSNKKASLSYRPNGVTTAPVLSTDYRNMDIYDGTSGTAEYIAKVSFRSNNNNYDYNATKWYLYSEDTGRTYVGLFETNASSANQFIDCSDESTNCTILSTTRTMSE